jgi:DNA-binding transcriptional LysR family regulator
VTMLPERTVQDEVRAGRLAALDISHGEFTRPTLIAYLHAKKEDEAFMPFVQWIKQVY